MCCRHRLLLLGKVSLRPAAHRHLPARGGARAGCGTTRQEYGTLRSCQLKSSRGARSQCAFRPHSRPCYSHFRSSYLRITSIAAGRDHLLALTSSGRALVHPITKNANSHGQLGFRKFDIPDPSSAASASRLHVELTPRAVANPYAKSSRYARESSVSAAAGLLPVSENLVDVDDTNIKFSDRFFEVPALRGVNVVQIAACARSSFVRTDAGRVLGWGANDYGYVMSSVPP